MNIDKEIGWVRLEKVLNQYGEYLVKELRSEMKKNKSNASYALSDSIEYKVFIKDRGGSTRYWVEITLLDYWKYVDEGRRPGRMPPVEKIAEWIRVKPVKIKPLSRAAAVESLSYAIQKTLKKKKGWAPPRAALVGWIEKKGIKANTMPTVESVAWAIAKSIAHYGTEGTDFFFNSVEKANAKFEPLIDEAIKEDINEWIEGIMDQSIEF